MRKLCLLFSVAIISLFAVSCEPDSPADNNPVENPGDNNPVENPGDNTDDDATGLTFTFQNDKVAANSAEVQVVPSDIEALYFANIVEASTLVDLDDEAIIESLMLSDDYNKHLGKGPRFIVAKELKSSTEYTAVVFDAKAANKLFRYTLTTEEAVEAIPADQFKVEIEVKDITATSATAIATPNSPINKYLFRVVTKLELDAYGIYDNDWEVMKYICENPYHGEYLQSGDKTLQCTLHPEMDYVAIAFNYENAESVYKGDEPVVLFRKAFKTPEAPKVDPNELFIYDNITPTAKGFTLDVTPVVGEEACWTYYVMYKKDYDETLATKPYNDIVRGAYFGLQNLAVEQGYLFHDIIQLDKLGKKGSNQIENYEPLKNNTEYVVILFYVDLESDDPTEVYDYNHVAVPFKTKESSGAAEMLVSEPIIERAVAGYTIKFNIKVDENAVSLYKGASPMTDNIAQYWDETDWNEIRAFFFLYPVNEETFAQAQTEVGCVISYTGIEAADEYVFFFEALTEENTRTQHVVKVTTEMFANAQ